MAFPASPTNGQVAVQNGITYTYATATNSWTRSPATLPTLSVLTDTFTGDGSTVSFALSVSPRSKDYVSINIDGVSQLKSAYNLTNNIVTFTGIPDVESIIEVKSWNATNVGVLTGLVFDSFTGDGSTVNYTLSTSPVSTQYTLVTIGGIVQEKTNYSLSGTTLTFSTAPPNDSPVEIMTFGPAVNTAVAAGSNTQVQFSNGTGLNASANLTFDTSTNTLTTTNLVVSNNTTFVGTVAGDNFVGDGSGLTNITGANVSGQVANALVAGTVTSSSQPNITSFGTLTSLTVSGTFNSALTIESFVIKTGATGSVTHDTSEAATFYHTGPSANFTANFTNLSLTDNKVTVLVLMIAQGSTAYIPSGFAIDNSVITVNWNVGVTPTGNANKTDMISYSVMKINGIWTVFGQFTYFG